MTPNNSSKDYCPNCQQITNHNCLFNQKQTSDREDDFHWEENYETIQCLGCENIQFRNRYLNEDMIQYDYEDKVERYEESKYFPKYLPNHHFLENIYILPDKIRIVYIESIEALKNNCYLLSGVGLRAVIEAICLDQKITGRNLELKINNLVKNKFITEKDGNRLHSIRFLGNDSVHEMEVPKEEKLRVALDIVEHLLKNLYLIDIKANQHLDMIITQYDDFKRIFIRKIKAKDSTPGEEKNIKEIFGKDYRRIETAYLSNFLKQIIDEIQANIIPNISIGKIENGDQFFINK